MDWFGAASAIFEKVKWTYRQFKLKYLVPFIIILLYTLFGALIFRMCELETDMAIRDRYRRAIDYAYDQVQRRMLEIRCHDTFLVNDSDSQEMHTRDAIDWFLVKLNLTQTIEERSDSSPWSWPGSMFYAGTLYTTIGYGRPSTQTTAGQFATILYIMFGIPLFLTTLKEVGKHLSRLLRKVYKKWIKARQHIPATPAPIRRYSLAMQKHLHLSLPSSRQSSIKRKKKQEYAERTLDDVELGLSDHETEEDEDELSLKDVVVVDGQKNVVSFSEEEEKGPRHLPTLQDQFDAKVDVHRGTPFPISLALFILILWICMSAGLFCIWEKEWGYFMSVYFFFVSISTVGLGDVVPTDQDMMPANFLLILIGLALLSMCINLIQRWIEHLLEDMLQQFVVEFEKIAAVTAAEEEEAKPLEIGISGTLAAAPLASIGQDHKPWNVADTAKNWFADKLASNLIKNHVHGSRDSLSSSEEETDWEDDKPEEQSSDSGRRVSVKVNAKIRPKRRRSQHNIAAMRAMQLMTRSAPGGGGFKNQLLSKMISNDRMLLLESTIKQKTNIRYAAVQTDNEFTELLNFLAIPKHEAMDSCSVAGKSHSLSQRTDQTYHTALERLSSEDSSIIVPFRSATVNFMELFTDSGIAEEATDSAATTPHASVTQSMIDESQQIHHLNRWLGMQVCSKCGHISRDGRLMQDRAIDARSSRSKSPAEADGKHVAFNVPEEEIHSEWSEGSEQPSIFVQSSPKFADPEVIADPVTEYRLAVDERHIGRTVEEFRTGSSPVDDDAHFHDTDTVMWSSMDIDDGSLLLPTCSSPIDLAIAGGFSPNKLLPSSISPLSSSRQSLGLNNATLEPSASICSLVDELINTVANSLDERKTELVDAEADGSGVATSSHSGESKSAEIDETSPRSREQTPSGSFSRVTSVVAHLATALAEEAVAQVSDLPKFVGR